MSTITAPGSSTQTHNKRKAPHTGHGRNPVPSKKALLAKQVDTLTKRCIAKVSFHANYERAAANCAYLSPRLYNRLLGANGANGLYVRMANVIFRALRDPSMPNDNTVDVNFLAHENLEEHLFEYQRSSSIWIDPIDINQQDLALIERANFIVSPCGDLNGAPNTESTVLSSTLETIIRERFTKEALALKQSLFIMHPVVGPLRVVLNSWQPANVNMDSMLLDKGIPYFGLAKDRTKITFTPKNANRLTVVDEFDSKKIDTFHFQIGKTRDVSARVFRASKQESTHRADWQKGIQPLPLAISFPDLANKIRDRFAKKPLLLGKTESFWHNRDWAFDIEFSKVTVLPSLRNTTDLADDEENNVKLFRMNPNDNRIIGGTKEVILTTDPKNARQAQKLTFKILDMDESLKKKDNETPWVSVQEIEKIIKSEKRPLAVSEKRVITLGTCKYLLALVKASGSPCPKPHECANLHDIWAVGKNTKIAIFPKSALQLQVVDTPHAYVLESLTVKISATGIDEGDSMLAVFSGDGEDEDVEKTIVPEEEAKQIFLESLPTNGIIHAKQQFKGLTGKGEKIKFKLDKLKSKETEGKSFYRGCMYKCGPETKIIIEGEKDSDVVISTKPSEINLANIDEKLLEFGIGGMTEQFKDVIARTTLSRSSYAAHVDTLGQKPSRGLLLYGPPGTGKTLLARQLGKILGVTGERIKLYTGSQIWNKWVGGSEKNVRKMFKEARKDQNRYGKDSPLHLLIIDEIDAFLRDRANAEKNHESSVVNTFIAELDGLSSKGDDSLNNIIVIGLTNFPDRIDDAAKRPGRLFPHIHIGLPDQKGRKEIFEIHTRGMREGGFLESDVDLDELVKMTVGRAGAFIEGMTAACAEYSLKRLWEQRVLPEEIKDHPAAKITRADFQQALQECLHKKKKEEIPAIMPATPRDRDEMAADLKRVSRLGGLPTEALQFLCDLKNAQYYKEYLNAMNHSFPRGALLYGPPGIGKKSFARAIRDLFNLDGQRYQHYKASELWPVGGSNLKSKIEKIIQPAKDAAKDLKGDAPLHVVVIEEIDALYSHKRETDNQYQSVLNQFLTELESLFEDDPKEMQNLLVIGIADRSPYGKLPDGILRHGRLGKHIDMTLPTPQGRREILEIYLSKYCDRGRIERPINLDALVEMTKDYPGAYIEGLISEAGMRVLRRAASLHIDPGAIATSAQAMLTMNDIVEAHKSMENDNAWKEMFV